VFLFLVNFSPFGSSVRYLHMTTHLGLTETLYGKMVSVESISAVAAAPRTAGSAAASNSRR
jgi:hypothetical protein